MTRSLISACMLLLCLASAVDAGWVKYRLADGRIMQGPTATAESLPMEPGHAVIEDPALSVSDPIWPIPPGCTAGTLEWTSLSAGNVLPLVVWSQFTDLFFTSTSPALLRSSEGCFQVNSWQELRTVYRASIAQVAMVTVVTQEFSEGLNHLNGWVAGVCTATNKDTCVGGSANCVTSCQNMREINEDYPGSGQLLTATNNVMSLRTDVYAFKDAHGW